MGTGSHRAVRRKRVTWLERYVRFRVEVTRAAAAFQGDRGRVQDAWAQIICEDLAGSGHFRSHPGSPCRVCGQVYGGASQS